MGQLLSARKMREQNEVHVDLGDDTFIRARREDMTSLLLEGRVPMPMLAAVQKMIDMPSASPLERIEALGQDGGRTLLEVVREHACKVAIEPLIVMVDDGNPDHLPVALLDTPKLMAIWTATAVIPGVSQVTAATFRPTRSADNVVPLPVKPNLPKVTQQLDTPEVEFVSG